MNHTAVQKCRYTRNKKGQGHSHMVHSLVNLKQEEKCFQQCLAFY